MKMMTEQAFKVVGIKKNVCIMVVILLTIKTCLVSSHCKTIGF